MALLYLLKDPIIVYSIITVLGILSIGIQNDKTKDMTPMARQNNNTAFSYI